MNAKLLLVSWTAACLILFNTGNAFSQDLRPEFRDIKGSFAQQAIIRLAQQGIVHGTDAGRFSPGEKVTRLQFALLIAKTLGVQPLFPSEAAFSDVPAGSTESGLIETMADLGLINGVLPQTFGGDIPVQRQDAAVILRKVLAGQGEVPAGSGEYSDRGQISPYAVDSVAYVTQKGWMKGSNGRFFPLQNLTRAEAAVLIDRLLTARKAEAQGALQQTENLAVKVEETKEIVSPVTPAPFPFTPVWGTDMPDVFYISPPGTLVARNRPGTGTLTVNAGSVSQPVTVEVRNQNPSGYQPPDTQSGPAGPQAFPALTYRVEEYVPDRAFRDAERKNHPGPAGGLLAEGDGWTGFLRQQGRDIIIDLGMLGPVSGVSLEFLHDSKAGITLPPYLKGSLSADGAAWYHLGSAYHGVEPVDAKVHNMTLSLTFPSVTARYLKLSFPVDVWVFARNLAVTGGGPADKPVILAPVERTVGSTGMYLQDPDLRDILLVYTGDRSYQQTLTASDFLPLVAYVDRQGKVKGQMFDTMLFSPTNRLASTKAGWNSYLEDLFAPDKQLHALEDTVARVNRATGRQTREKVILTLPYPDPGQRYFDESPTSFSEIAVGREKAAVNRFEAVRWYYEKMMDEWTRAGFLNLDLAGIYWFRESVDKTVYGEAGLVRQVSQMVRAQGQDFFWIPFYGAQGYEDWQSLGFTHVFLQPSYYFSQAPQDDRMDRAAELAGKYRTGIQIEFDNRILYIPRYYNLFYNQLKKGHRLGLDGKTVNAYHIGIKGTLLDTVYSDIPQLRAIYDDLYRWISGTYK